MRVLISAALLLVAGGALADNHFSYTTQCPKDDPGHSLPVNDAPGHALMIGRHRCPISGAEINGLALKQQDVYATAERNGVELTVRGYVILSVEGGDKAFATFQGKGTVRDKTGDEEGTWKITGGTGKLKGVEGKGTFKRTDRADGTATDEIEGTWNFHQSVAEKLRSKINK